MLGRAMSSQRPGYAMKSPRSRTHGLVARAIEQVEDGIYIVVAVLLVVAGLFARWGAVNKLANDVQHHSQALAVLTDLLPTGLLPFLISGLLHPVRAAFPTPTLA